MEAVSVDVTKNELRQELKLKRLNFVKSKSQEELKEVHRKISQNIHKLLDVEFTGNNIKLTSYKAFSSEVDLSEFQKTCSEYQVVYPRVTDHGLTFHQTSGEQDFELSSWGVMEPKAELKQTPLSECKMALVPGLGFSRTGQRVGYGQGHYDKSLCGESLLKVGVNYSSQIFEESSAFEAHDVSMDYVVTENYILKVGKKGESWK